MMSFKGKHFPKDVILFSVHFYLRYSVSYQDLEEIMQERGVDVDHTTLNRWVIEYSPLIAKEAQKRKAPTSRSWRMIRDGEDALLVNWLEIEIVNAAGKVTYKNSWVTSLPVDQDKAVELAACGRARWKVENESFNIPKTKGYNLEHNFGHGDKNLAALLATMNLLAFAFHTLLDLTTTAWQKARQCIGPRKRFFQHLAAITCYLLFPNWDALIQTLIEGEPPPQTMQA